MRKNISDPRAQTPHQSTVITMNVAASPMTVICIALAGAKRPSHLPQISEQGLSYNGTDLLLLNW